MMKNHVLFFVVCVHALFLGAMAVREILHKHSSDLSGNPVDSLHSHLPWYVLKKWHDPYHNYAIKLLFYQKNDLEYAPHMSRQKSSRILEKFDDSCLAV